MANLDLEINEDPAVIYGGFWRRTIAIFLDCLILFVVNAPAFYAQIYSAKYVVPLMLIGNIVSISYYVYFIGRWGATYGKKWLALKVVDTSGSPVTYSQSCVRYLPWFLLSLPTLIDIFFQYSAVPHQELDAMPYFEKVMVLQSHTVFPSWMPMLMTLFLICEIISLLMSKKNQSLHDVFAKTVVVKVT